MIYRLSIIECHNPKMGVWSVKLFNSVFANIKTDFNPQIY